MRCHTSERSKTLDVAILVFAILVATLIFNSQILKAKPLETTEFVSGQKVTLREN